MPSRRNAFTTDKTSLLSPGMAAPSFHGFKKLHYRHYNKFTGQVQLKFDDNNYIFDAAEFVF